MEVMEPILRGVGNIYMYIHINLALSIKKLIIHSAGNTMYYLSNKNKNIAIIRFQR